MTRSNRAIREVEERLAAGPKPVPPQDLLQQIVDEIPEDLGADAADRRSSTPWWKLAAAVVLVAGGGLLARQMIRETPTAGEFVEQELEQTRRDRLRATGESEISDTGRSDESSDELGAVDEAPRTESPKVELVSPDAVDGVPATEDREPEVSEEGTGYLENSGQVEPETHQGAPAGDAGGPAPLASERVQAQARAAAPAPAPAPARGETMTARRAETSALYVKVSDPEGRALPGVTVTLEDGGAPRVQVTNAAGQARFLGLRPGLWRMTCELEGHSTVEYPGLEVWEDSDRSIEVTLSQAVQEVITIRAESPLLDERRVSEKPRISLPNADAIAAPRPTRQTPSAELEELRALGYVAARVGAPSTGGTAEPNDQPYGDMFFGSYGENPFIDTEDDALSTFGLDVDTGSWTLVRSYVDRGNLPPRDAVRVEELVNAFDYGDPAPRRGDFELVAEGARTPYGESSDYHLLRFGLRARDVLRRERPPVVLIFTVDTSGSMAQENRLGLVKRSLELLVDELGPRDEVGLVTFGSSARVVLDPTADRGEILRALDWLRPEGSTNAEHGLRTAYDLVQRYRREGSLHRVILCSDGVANVGATGPDSILESIGRWARDGIELTTIGFGMGNYNDLLMEQLADRGDGRYHYVDTLDEARRVFVDDLAGTLVTVAEEARAQVELHAESVERYRLLGYENRDIADRDFRNDKVDAGEIGAGHHVTALYEVKLRDGLRGRDVVATLRLRYRSAETGRWEELAHDLTAGELAERWERAPRSLRLAGTVAELAELLKGTYWAREGDLDALAREAHDLARESRGDAEVAELARVARRAAELTGWEQGPAEDE